MCFLPPGGAQPHLGWEGKSQHRVPPGAAAPVPAGAAIRGLKAPQPWKPPGVCTAPRCCACQGHPSPKGLHQTGQGPYGTATRDGDGTATHVWDGVARPYGTWDIWKSPILRVVPLRDLRGTVTHSRGCMAQIYRTGTALRSSLGQTPQGREHAAGRRGAAPQSCVGRDSITAVWDGDHTAWLKGTGTHGSVGWGTVWHSCVAQPCWGAVWHSHVGRGAYGTRTEDTACMARLRTRLHCRTGDIRHRYAGQELYGTQTGPVQHSFTGCRPYGTAVGWGLYHTATQDTDLITHLFRMATVPHSYTGQRPYCTSL